MKNIPSLISRNVVSQITESLDDLGIMFRIFSRVKSTPSLEKKIDSKAKYRTGEAKIQDLIGVRVVLYFPDDIKIVHRIISSLYEESEKDASIDGHNDNTFKPVRYNLIYKLTDSYEILHEYTDCVDDTFELQIRTVFSEGWHEVEHDLRYKYNGDWENSPVESRLLNGIYASLETNEWTMIQILEEVAYKHYKQENWESMLRQRLRLRLVSEPLHTEIIAFFNNNSDVAKQFFRIERAKLISEMYRVNFRYPLTMSNILYFSNLALIKNPQFQELIPEEVTEDINAMIQG